jgi:hypothetical protein
MRAVEAAHHKLTGHRRCSQTQSADPHSELRASKRKQRLSSFGRIPVHVCARLHTHTTGEGRARVGWCAGVQVVGCTMVLRDRSAIDGGQLLRHGLDRLLEGLQAHRLLGETRLQLQCHAQCNDSRCPSVRQQPLCDELSESKRCALCATGTLCASRSVCGDFLAIILTVCCSSRSAFSVSALA